MGSDLKPGKLLVAFVALLLTAAAHAQTDKQRAGRKRPIYFFSRGWLRLPQRSEGNAARWRETISHSLRHGIQH